jgi:curved DNA-binding protein CbpA
VPIITPHITPPSQKEFRPSPVPAAAAAPSAPVHPAVAQPHSKPSGYTPPQETPVIRAAFASSVRAKSESRPIEIKAQPAAGVKPQPPTQSASTAPARQSLLLDGMRANIQDMAQKMGKVTHFELLGLSQDCTSDEVGTAFVRAARQFHPDRLVAAGLQDLQPIAERILARINEATMVLSDPARRAEYLASLAMGGSGGQTSLPSLLEAENLFLRGEVYLKRGEYAKAAELFKSAAQGNPSEPQYRAFLAWARFEDPKARKETLVRDTLKVIEGVVKDRPRFARGFFWIGQCWKFLNEMDKAAHAFRETVQIDSSFIDASRELRLIEMRKSKANSTKSGKSGSNPSHGGGGGLMGKFFKK